MRSPGYHFETRWRVQASPEEVTEILRDAKSLLRWSFRVTESHPPYGFSLEAWGDLEGKGVWAFTREGDYTNIHYLWTIHARKPLLRWLSPLLRPVFAANHRWAMARGEESLIREIARRHERLR